MAAREVTGAVTTAMVAGAEAEAAVNAAAPTEITTATATVMAVAVEVTAGAAKGAVADAAVSAAAPLQTTTATVMVMVVAAAAKEAAANAAVVTRVAAIAGEATEAEVIAAETTLKAKPRAILEIMTTMAAIAEAQMLLMVAGRHQMTMTPTISRNNRLHQPLPHNRPLHRLKDWFQVDLSFRETARLAANLCLPARRERRSSGGGNSGRG